MCKKDSNKKIMNIEAISSEFICKGVKKINSKELFDEKKESKEEKISQKKDTTDDEYYFIFWN